MRGDVQLQPGAPVGLYSELGGVKLAGPVIGHAKTLDWKVQASTALKCHAV